MAFQFAGECVEDRPVESTRGTVMLVNFDNTLLNVTLIDNFLVKIIRANSLDLSCLLSLFRLEPKAHFVILKLL